MGDVVKFPNKIVESRAPKSMEQVDGNIENVQLYHISETLEQILPVLFGRLAMAGFDLSASDDVKNGALLVEALRSVLCRYYGINHPFQEIAESVFKSEGEGVLSLNDGVHVDFKKVESKI
jgi:hypothetical protein